MLLCRDDGPDRFSLQLRSFHCRRMALLWLGHQKALLDGQAADDGYDFTLASIMLSWYSIHPINSLPFIQEHLWEGGTIHLPSWLHTNYLPFTSVTVTLYLIASWPLPLIYLVGQDLDYYYCRNVVLPASTSCFSQTCFRGTALSP